MSEVRRKPKRDYYKVLQVDPSAELEVIEASYRALSKKYHPDLNDTPDASSRMAEINHAYNVLRDQLKRRDYDLLRTASSFVAATPASSTSYAASANSARPTAAASSTRTTTSEERPASTSNGTSSGRSQASAAQAVNRTAPKVSRPSHHVYIETKATGWWHWLVLMLVLAVAVIGGFFLAKFFLENNPSPSSLLGGSVVQPTQVAAIETAVRTTRISATTPLATSPAPVGSLSLSQLSSYLNSSELYEGRVVESQLLTETLRLQVRLSKNGRILNGLDSSPNFTSTDELNALRQAELTAYNLTYGLFGRFNDLKNLDLRLSDSTDDKKIVYRAIIPRGLAYNFSSWRGTMDPKMLSQQDFIKAGQEDRLLLHMGSPVENNVRNRINQPDKNNLKAELVNLGISLNSLDVSLDTNGAIVGYYAERPEEQKLTDYARIFYALYTRFPNLDKVQVQDSTPGTPSHYSKASSRALFNLITSVVWAQLTFDNRAKELLDRLPGTLNVPSLNQTMSSGGEIQVNPKANEPIKTWQIVNPGIATRLSQISSLSTTKSQQFILVKVPLKNLNAEAQWPLPNAFFSLTDAQGRTYQPDPTATISYLLDVERNSPPGPTEQKKDLALKLIFDIPLNSSGLRLIFQDHETRANLPLTLQ
ncbi:MAG: DnaJ domain-containing protein [Chloroflexota bacterium]